ncbi:MAG TPA: YtxH domain-containing protein [Chitinophagaceae bacterium]|jgi:gas vesicle protein
MNFTNKFVAGLILGAAAGAMVAAFLQTEKGKEILGDIKEATGDASENVKSHWANFEKELNGLLKKGKQFVDDLEKKAKNAASTFK